MADTTSRHIPVLLQEVLHFLKPAKGDIVIDATLGGGGHSGAILKKIGASGKLLAIDADPLAVEKFNNLGLANAKAVAGNFRNIQSIARESGFESADVVLFDFGLSSDQLDNPERGFSFQVSGPLDMRMDTLGQETSAGDFVNKADADEIKTVIKEYSEEINARRVAQAIVFKRKRAEIKTTEELFEIIKQALPAKFRFKAGDVARRVFQALRIHVNKELEVIPEGLSGAFDLLAPKGRLGAISFHSLEDRIVKKYFAELARGCICPPDFPICSCDQKPKAKLLTAKPVMASEREQAENSRSKSAKFRAIEKV